MTQYLFYSPREYKHSLNNEYNKIFKKYLVNCSRENTMWESSLKGVSQLKF